MPVLTERRTPTYLRRDPLFNTHRILLVDCPAARALALPRPPPLPRRPPPCHAGLRPHVFKVILCPSPKGGGRRPPPPSGHDVDQRRPTAKFGWKVYCKDETSHWPTHHPSGKRVRCVGSRTLRRTRKRGAASRVSVNFADLRTIFNTRWGKYAPIAFGWRGL